MDLIELFQNWNIRPKNVKEKVDIFKSIDYYNADPYPNLFYKDKSTISHNKVNKLIQLIVNRKIVFETIYQDLDEEFPFINESIQYYHKCMVFDDELDKWFQV